MTFPRHFSVKIASGEPSASGGRRTWRVHWEGGKGTRQGRLKIKSTLVGNDSVSPRRHGALKYERYDEPRLSPPRLLSLSLSFSPRPPSHRHLVPRWCISANLRSLVLPLSFLPASPLVFPLPLLLPLVFLVSEDPLFSPLILISEDTKDDEGKNGGQPEEERSIPGLLGGGLYRRDLIASIRYFGGHCVYVYMASVFLCPCRSFDTRYLIRDREARRSKTD